MERESLSLNINFSFTNLIKQKYLLSKNLKGGVGNISKGMMKKFGIEGAPGKMGKLNEAVQGEIFEESMRMAMKAAVAIPGADFDFEAGKPPSQALQKVFGKPIVPLRTLMVVTFFMV